MRAIFVIDPGGATGVARGIFDEKAKTVEDAVKTALHVESFSLNHRRVVQRNKVYHDTLSDTIGNVPYSDLFQAQVLYGEFRRWKRWCVFDLRLGPDWVDLVIEDFTLRPGPHSGGKEGISPVRIAWAIAGIQVGIADEFARRHRHHHTTKIKWQEPHKMGPWTDAKLKKLGLWVPGRDHERAAFRHLLAHLSATLR